MTSYIYIIIMGMTHHVYPHNNIMTLYCCNYMYINMIYCFIDAQDD